MKLVATPVATAFTRTSRRRFAGVSAASAAFATLALCAGALVAGALPVPAQAQVGASADSRVFVRDRTPDGHAFLSGGVSLEDRAEMEKVKTDYSLWVSTVARPSGAWLAEVKLQITDLKDSRVVVDRVLEGPWFMVSLPAGRYEVRGTFTAQGATNAQAQTQTVVVGQGLRQAILRFDSRAIVSPDLK